MSKKDSPVFRWAVYNLAWWIVKRHARRRRRKLIAIGMIALVVVGGLVASRAGSD